MGGTKPVKQVTTLAPPVGAYSASSGSIAAKVLDSTGAVRPEHQRAGRRSDRRDAADDDRGLLVLRVPHARVPTPCRSSRAPASATRRSSIPSQTASVSVGQTASVQFQYDTAATITVTGLVAAGRAARDRASRSAVANTGLQPYGQYSFAAGRRVADAAVPVRERLHGVRGELHRQQPARQGHQPQPVLPDRGRSPLDGHAGRDDATTVPLYTLPVHVQNSTAVRGRRHDDDRDRDDQVRGAVHVGVHERHGVPAPRRRSASSRPTPTGDSVTALPLGHWTITARATGTEAVGTVERLGRARRRLRRQRDGRVDGTAFAGPITVVVS